MVEAGDVSIDPATGEVVEWSGGAAEDEVTRLTRICAGAQRAIKEHESVYNAARAALERLLIDTGRRSVQTAYGTPSLRNQTRRTGRPERVLETARRYELSPQQESLIWTCATTLDAKQLDALVDAGALPADAVAEIVESKQVRFVQVIPPSSSFV